MLAKDRQNEIINILTQRATTVKMLELSQRFSVSTETIRRDLETLQSAGLVQRVHGGVILAAPKSATSALSVYSATHAKGQQKREAIGRATAKLIQENETLLLASSTTVLEVARNLKHLTHLTILTNSLPVVQELADTSFDIYFLGGKVHKMELYTYGETLMSALHRHYVDRAIIGAAGITFEYGISDFENNDYLTRDGMFKHAKQIVVVAASDKFGHNAFCIRNSLDHVDTIVTNSDLSQEYIDGLQERNIQLVLAPAE